MSRAAPPPVRRRALAPQAQRHGHLGRNENLKSNRRVSDKNIGRYIIFLGSEAAPLGANELEKEGRP
jgi:hypothetical protein